MESYEKLLLENKAWVKERLADDPNYFRNLAQGQTPEFLWIGCSDSRVPANEITNSNPGQIFVHRNIANLVVHTDLNMLSVLEIAVEKLKVNHIIVCGHYNCGGVRSALSHQPQGLINKWLRNIKDVYRLHQKELDEIRDSQEQLDRLVEINVMEQVNNLAKTSIIQKAWKREKRPTLHGWVYSVHNGILKELYKMEHNSPMDDIYRFDLD